MGVSLFNDFYFEFIWLASNLEYISEILIWKFKHKLTPHLQDPFNSGIELPKMIFALVKHCLSIYEQMQVIDQIRKKAKSSTIVRTTANISLRAVTSSSRVPTVSNKNISFLRLSNTLRGSITSMPRNLVAEISQLMKEGRYFNCKGGGHTMLNCPEKAKIFAIIDVLDIDNIKNINQEKE